ncbi:MAG: ABC-F family ATP-binding cassette domain-containing protein [Treponema sp.]|uniref:ABC-F family ATP-binding cassette domain-containing protein n=1 Tax=Treponema sp. TaxID=166 RepID=UPI00298EB7E7|nr:ABC-F family ATP-binding cassette domain-containing protein [Treponema sp.]MDD5811032.1 ABC-F family ATP-binding cassette domain-containing protein [Treponema sp.]
MAFVQFSKVSLAFGDRDILKNVSVNLATGSKVALTGANGAGKSTLIKIMAGLTEPDSGERICQKDTRIAYLPQSGLTHHGSTLLEEADKAFEFGYEIQREAEQIGEQLKSNPDNTDYLVARHAELLAKLEDSLWYRRQAQAESVLLGLGFTREDFTKNTEQFSGGWQMRIALAKALMQNPDILLLDEPTNYLDIEARNWLEVFLKNFKGGFLLVSHDRYFLDVTINEVYELFGGDLKSYPGNFSHYEKVREVELQTLMAEYEKQQAEIHHLEDFINRFGYKATKAAQAQERQKMLDKLLANKIEIPESLKKIHFSFPPAPHSGNIVLRMSEITKSYDGSFNVLDNLELLLEKGERLVVAGHNGAGKSTLLRIVAGVDKDFTGNIETGAGVSIGYFSQDNAETISGTASVLEHIESIAPLELIPKVRDMLGAFLFRGDDVNKSLNVLSGGEKTRVALLQLLLRPVNLLILDEPTNHLDMHSKDVLLSALKDFGGTVIFVSHDRGFIQDLATRVLELTPGKFRNFKGDYEYYMQRLADEEAGIVGNYDAGTVHSNPNAVNKAAVKINAGQASPSSAQSSSNQSEKSAGALNWEEQKKLEAERRKKEKEVARLEDEIAKVEGDLSDLQNKMSDPAVYSNGEKAKAVQAEITSLEAKLDELNAAWELAAGEL